MINTIPPPAGLAPNFEEFSNSTMYIRKRKAFKELLDLIRHLEECPDDIEAVRRVNERLVGLLADAEKAIARHIKYKKQLTTQIKTHRLPKTDTRKLRGKRKRVDGYIKAQRDQIFIWKSFGDALAFIYLDPFSIKHMFFDTDDYEVKQDAGAITGKKGMQAELQVLNDALDHGVPAILCDLTNTLRFGDVCLLGGSDPYPIEVKTSSRINQRGMRQQTKLEKLHGFFALDAADDFRGFSGPTSRVSSGTLTYHRDAINKAIGKALDNGYCVVSPENGLSYLVMRTDSYSNEVLSELDLESPEGYDLNHFKNGHTWMAYMPFMLSIREPEHVLDFVEGRVYILAFIEGSKLAALFESADWEVRYRQDEQYSIQCLNRLTGAYFGVSCQFIARAAFEFLSFESIVSTQSPMAEHLVDLSMKADQGMDRKAFKQRLRDTLGEDDEWIERILSLQSLSNDN